MHILKLSPQRNVAAKVFLSAFDARGHHTDDIILISLTAYYICNYSCNYIITAEKVYSYNFFVLRNNFTAP